MTSSVRRRPRDAGTSGLSGSTAGDGAVMLLTRASPRLASPRRRSRGPRGGRVQRAGRDAVGGRQRAYPARAGRPLARGDRRRARADRRRARLDRRDARRVLLSRGHLGLVLLELGLVRVFLGDPVLLGQVRGTALT